MYKEKEIYCAYLQMETIFVGLDDRLSISWDKDAGGGMVVKDNTPDITIPYNIGGMNWNKNFSVFG